MRERQVDEKRKQIFSPQILSLLCSASSPTPFISFSGNRRQIYLCIRYIQPSAAATISTATDNLRRPHRPLRRDGPHASALSPASFHATPPPLSASSHAMRGPLSLHPLTPPRRLLSRQCRRGPFAASSHDATPRSGQQERKGMKESDKGGAGDDGSPAPLPGMVTGLKGFQTFVDKVSAINHVTGVSEALCTMIQEYINPEQTLAVGNEDYKEIIHKGLGIPFLCGATGSVRHRRRSRFPIVVGRKSQSPENGGHRGGLTARQISRVRCLPGASANSGTHDASFDSTTGNPSTTRISTRDHLP
uniref:Uncharacterized protein n=1 Tax=Leersia perrieri TaxID=77586 RepID=A0A0D9WHU5_9ORYZ